MYLWDINYHLHKKQSIIFFYGFKHEIYFIRRLYYQLKEDFKEGILSWDLGEMTFNLSDNISRWNLKSKAMLDPKEMPKESLVIWKSITKKSSSRS